MHLLKLEFWCNELSSGISVFIYQYWNEEGSSWYGGSENGSDNRYIELVFLPSIACRFFFPPALAALLPTAHGRRGVVISSGTPPLGAPRPTIAVGVVTVYLATLITRWERTRYVIESRQPEPVLAQNCIIGSGTRKVTSQSAPIAKVEGVWNDDSCQQAHLL